MKPPCPLLNPDNRIMPLFMSGHSEGGTAPSRRIACQLSVFVIDGRATCLRDSREVFSTDDPLLVGFVRFMVDAITGIEVRPDEIVQEAFGDMGIRGIDAA